MAKDLLASDRLARDVFLVTLAAADFPLDFADGCLGETFFFSGIPCSPPLESGPKGVINVMCAVCSSLLKTSVTAVTR